MCRNPKKDGSDSFLDGPEGDGYFFLPLPITMKWNLPFFQQSKPEITEQWLEEHPTFCMMPFVHLHVTQLGTVTPCCQTPWQEEHAFGNANTQSLEEIWQGEKMNTFRAQMLRGERDSRCERCYAKEVTGWKTLRNITNKNYAHHLERVKQTDKKGSMQNAAPVYYDLRFSNVCNYRCRICGPWSSSKWHKDAKALGMTEAESSLTHATADSEGIFRQFEDNIDQVEELYFAGGEPLIMDEHYRLLELLIKHGKRSVRLMYNTNFSTFTHKHWNALELWKQFDHINLAASLDAMGPRAELLRKEQDWEKVMENLKQLRQEAPHVKFMVSPTVYVLNVQQLPDFHRSMVDAGHIPVEDFVPTLLMQPEYYNIQALPLEVKEAVREKVTKHIEWIESQPSGHEEKKAYVRQTYLNLLEHMDHVDQSHLLPELRKRTNALDQLRNEQSAAVFPELGFLFE